MAPGFSLLSGIPCAEQLYWAFITISQEKDLFKLSAAILMEKAFDPKQHLLSMPY
jgi:hypothetical protein